MTDEQLTPGTRIKNYVLEEQLGKGASGEVWKASDGTKTVALKLMNPQLLNSRNVAKHFTRLQREIEALNHLQSHPNIPSIFDYDLEYERPYLAMQFIGGQSYDRLIKSGDILKIPLNRRLDIIRELAMALYAAHSEDIIHRDIKPANVSGTENPYLLDFSVALPEADLQKTQANIGTKLYMPWDGIPDKQGDVYSFGLLVYEIIFGRHAIFTPDDTPMLKATPFMPQVVAGDRVKNREWHVPTKLPLEELPSELVGKDLQPLDEVFQKVLGSRSERYVDPRDFATDIRRAIEEGLAPAYVAPEAAPAPAPDELETTPVDPTPLEPHQPQPIVASDDMPTIVENMADDHDSTPVEPHISWDAGTPTLIEEPEQPAASSIPQDEPDNAFEDGQTVLEDPPQPADVRPTPPPAPSPQASPSPEPPRRPPSLEPERRVVAPPMPDRFQPEPDKHTATIPPAPPKKPSGRSPLLYMGIVIVIMLIIVAVLVIQRFAPATTTDTLTPGAVALDVTATTPPATRQTADAESTSAQVVVAATEEPTASPIPPTATRRPTSTPMPRTDTPVPPTDTSEPAATDVPPSATQAPTNTPTPQPTTAAPTATNAPPTATDVPPSDTPIPPTATRRPTETPTPVPPTATRRPTSTPTPINPVKSTLASVAESTADIPPTATRVGDTATLRPTATPTEEGLSADLSENIQMLRRAIIGDTYECSVFNAVYEHLEARLELDDPFADNLAYEIYGDDILREMARIYRGFCRNQTSDDERLPLRYEEDNSDLDVLLEDISRVLALTPVPTSTATR